MFRWILFGAPGIGRKFGQITRQQDWNIQDSLPRPPTATPEASVDHQVGIVQPLSGKCAPRVPSKKFQILSF